MNKNEMYFCLVLTEGEHWFAERDIRNECERLGGLEIKYYRQLKEGHVPLYREVKIVGEKPERLKKYLGDNHFTDNMEPNPHRLDGLRVVSHTIVGKGTEWAEGHGL